MSTVIYLSAASSEVQPTVFQQGQRRRTKEKSFSAAPLRPARSPGSWLPKECGDTDSPHEGNDCDGTLLLRHAGLLPSASDVKIDSASDTPAMTAPISIRGCLTPCLENQRSTPTSALMDRTCAAAMAPPAQATMAICLGNGDCFSDVRRSCMPSSLGLMMLPSITGGVPMRPVIMAPPTATSREGTVT